MLERYVPSEQICIVAPFIMMVHDFITEHNLMLA